jgi:excisionase family DNA binding protein
MADARYAIFVELEIVVACINSPGDTVSHMKARTLYSAREAADQLGVSRKTIQRWLANGQLQWHGTIRRGQHAKGIDLNEARAIQRTQVNRTDRAKSKPVWLQVKDFLTDIDRLPAPVVEPPRIGVRTGNVRVGAVSAVVSEPYCSPEQVIAIYSAAVANGADVDFMLYCVYLLREGNGLFVHMLLGHELNPLLTDPLIPYAAKQMRARVPWLSGVVGNDGSSTAKLNSRLRATDFRKLWLNLMKTCHQAPIFVEPAVVFCRNTKKASVELVPSWLNEAPRGVLPIVGGRRSVVRVRRSRSRAKLDSIATRIANKLEGDNDGDKQVRLRVLLDYSSDPLLADSRWKRRVREFAARQPFLGEDQLPLARNLQREIHSVLHGILTAAEYFDLTMDEARTFLLEWQRLKADISERRNMSYNDAIESFGLSSSVQVMRSVLADVFGVSRQSLAKAVPSSRKRYGQSSIEHETASTVSNAPRRAYFEADRGDEPLDEELENASSGWGAGLL